MFYVDEYRRSVFDDDNPLYVKKFFIKYDIALSTS